MYRVESSLSPKVAAIRHVDPLETKSCGIQVLARQFRKDARTWRRVLFAPLGHRENLVTQSPMEIERVPARLNAPAALSNASLYERIITRGESSRVFPHRTNVKTDRRCPDERQCLSTFPRERTSQHDTRWENLFLDKKIRRLKCSH